ncbi:MAG: hypothetical protein DI498_11960 [Paracoccus denitrificans]|nr:MAG: hypothetical protein DI498_11960 [Paracoccus denitrificans]PZO83452.1 MAG: hypothetical protein DI633_11960 [Paracoccus denitrificans]
MFTVEHEFDASVITLIDEGGGTGSQLSPDIIITTFDDRVVVEQEDDDGETMLVVFSLRQLDELRAALNLPEGSYRLDR